MKSQKAENLLNLALDASLQEREKSEELNVGYDEKEDVWNLIIKYSGNLSEVRQISESVNMLMNEYAIVTIRENQIEKLAGLSQVEYIEKPKRLYFQVENGKRVSCINEVQGPQFSLLGEGALVGIIDSGIDYRLKDFRNEDGSTRILAIWDQSLQKTGAETLPEGYDRGVEYTEIEINQALKENRRLRTEDISGHGTAVAAIAAGSGKEYRGVAAQSNLIVVKMGNSTRDGFPRTTELMLGIDYVIRKAIEYQRPVAINISFGNTYGNHEGTSLLERYIDDVSNIWKNCICIGTGNEAASAGHTSGKMVEGVDEQIELAVQERQTDFSVQIWKEYTDEVEISIISPSGVRLGPIQEKLGTQRFQIENTQILLYYGEPSPYSTAQEIYLDFIPETTYVLQGIWSIILTPRKVVTGVYHLWLPGEGALNRGTAFLFPTSDKTLTIPSTADRAISVGAYNALNFSYADFSGRGGTGKPDLVAPGVNVITAAAGGGYMEVSGTSFATPFVTGGAALLMQWGIVNGNDPYLYGEKVKAYLQRGARELPGISEYPNPQVGYGALCVRDSLPE